MAPVPVRVAIIGGGIGGCTLARGLLQYPHIKFDIFEGRSTFSERGAGVAIAPNAQNALRAMGLQADELLAAAGGVYKESMTCFIAHGDHKGDKILELPAGVCWVDRVKWLDILLKDIPQDRLHANKKLASVDQTASNGAYTLHFEDGSSHEADVVIGCDGIRSKLRQIVLGPEHRDKWGPVFGGYWDARGRMSAETVTALFGGDIAQLAAANQIGLVGDGAFMMFASADHGRTFYVIVCATAGPKYDRSSAKTQLSKELLEKSFGNWDDHLRAGMVEALMADDSGPGVVFSQWHSAATPTYFRDRLCIMGDAAHATSPWMGQGAAQAMEDACVLSTLLGAVRKHSDLSAALQAFDKVRRGRPEFVVEHSQKAALVLTGQISMNPADVEHLDPAQWWKSVRSIDMAAHVDESKRLFEKINADGNASRQTSSWCFLM